MAPEDLLLRLHRAYTEAEMRGWDFSVLDGRLDAEDPPWDFEADCLAAQTPIRLTQRRFRLFAHRPA